MNINKKALLHAAIASQILKGDSLAGAKRRLARKMKVSVSTIDRSISKKGKVSESTYDAMLKYFSDSDSNRRARISQAYEIFKDGGFKRRKHDLIQAQKEPARWSKRMQYRKNKFTNIREQKENNNAMQQIYGRSNLSDIVNV